MQGARLNILRVGFTGKTTMEIIVGPGAPAWDELGSEDTDDKEASSLNPVTERCVGPRPGCRWNPISGMQILSWQSSGFRTPAG